MSHQDQLNRRIVRIRWLFRSLSGELRSQFIPQVGTR
jgi:hypothetical protein